MRTGWPCVMKMPHRTRSANRWPPLSPLSKIASLWILPVCIQRRSSLTSPRNSQLRKQSPLQQEWHWMCHPKWRLKHQRRSRSCAGHRGNASAVCRSVEKTLSFSSEERFTALPITLPLQSSQCNCAIFFLPFSLKNWVLFSPLPFFSFCSKCQGIAGCSACP